MRLIAGLRGKKGQEVIDGPAGEAGQKWLQFLLFGISSIILMFLFIYFVYGTNVPRHEIPADLEHFIDARRFTTASTCFAYFDPDTGRTFPGVIDPDKFNQDQLESCFISADNKPVFQIYLKETDATISTPGWNPDVQPKYRDVQRVLIAQGDRFIPSEMTIYGQ